MVDEALLDSVIDQEEERQLEKSRHDLGIDSEDPASIEKRAGLGRWLPTLWRVT